jgi:hypothetical protein
MVKTTREQLGEAYERAQRDLFQKFDPVSPRVLGAIWREHYGLYHRNQTKWFTGKSEGWIEFRNDADYTAFMLRWS